MSVQTSTSNLPIRDSVWARPFNRHGNLLSVGAVAWAISQIVVGGLDPANDTSDLLIYGAGSALFQAGLLALLRVLWVSGAIGSGRIARTVLRVEAVLVTLALLSTIVDAFAISNLDQTGWAILDATWPLSMLGMFLLGIRVAIAGRWKGAARWWPLIAESWAIVTIPVMGAVGPSAATVVSVIHLLVGYTVLGRLVARRDH